jgi:hypothetical protein
MEVEAWVRQQRVRECCELWDYQESICRAEGLFFPGDYRDEGFDVVLFEEWENDAYSGNLFQIRRLLERKSFVADVKHRCPRVVKCTKPCIIVSNEGTEKMSYPLIRRLTIIHAVNYAVDNGFIEVPKDETNSASVSEEVETICLSSEEEGTVEEVSQEKDSEKENIPPQEALLG